MKGVEAMAATREDIKDNLRSAGRSIADLSRDTDIPYPRLSGALNGYWSLPWKQEDAVRAALRRYAGETTSPTDGRAR